MLSRRWNSSSLWVGGQTVVEGPKVVLTEVIQPEAEANVVTLEKGVGFIQGRIPPRAQNCFTLESATKTQVVFFQADLDSRKAIVSL